MEFAGKDFKFYWDIIEFPFYLGIIWIIASTVTAIFSFSLYLSIFSWYSNLIIFLAIFGFIGWRAVKERKTGLKEAAWAGAIAGVLIGLISAVISIVLVNFFPQILEFYVQQALQISSEAPADFLRSAIKIQAYVGLITGPLINAIIGAVASTLTGLVAKKI